VEQIDDYMKTIGDQVASKGGEPLCVYGTPTAQKQTGSKAGHFFSPQKLLLVILHWLMTVSARSFREKSTWFYSLFSLLV
jgi:hypothetical protein